MEMNTNSSKVAHKAVLGWFPILRKISKSWVLCSLLEGVFFTFPFEF